MNLTDQQLADKINAYMANHLRANRSEIAKGVGISNYMLEKINKLGLVKLPPPLSFKQSAQVSKAKRKPEVVRFVINPNKKQAAA